MTKKKRQTGLKAAFNDIMAGYRFGLALKKGKKVTKK